MYSAGDIITLAKTLWGEARGEGQQGMAAVAWVVRNRAAVAAKIHYPQFGDGTIKGTCLVPWQFSSWNPGNYRQSVEAVTLDVQSYQVCMMVALRVLFDEIPDPTENAKFYWADTIPTPRWAIGKKSIKIGHQFFLPQVLV